MINILSLTKVIFNIVIRYSGISNPIINNWNNVFILKFYFLLYFFLVLITNFLLLSTYKLINKPNIRII